jgi:hypothetical protein
MFIPGPTLANTKGYSSYLTKKTKKFNGFQAINQYFALIFSVVVLAKSMLLKTI